MIKNEKGVTLVALVIMIIVITILATVATYTGLSTISDMRVTSLKKDLEAVEEAVKTVRSKSLVDSSLKYYTLGDSVNGKDSIMSKVGIKEEDYPYCRYFENKKLKSDLNISDINGDYIVNFETGKVYSVSGAKKDGNTYYSLDQINEKNNSNNIKTNEGYMKDGLVLELDGIYNTKYGYNDKANDWYDLTGRENDAKLTVGTAAWNDKALDLDGESYFTVKSPVSDSFGTVEVCVSVDSSFKPQDTDEWYRCSCIFGCEIGGTQKDWGVVIDKNGYFAIGYDNHTINSSKIYALDGKKHTVSYSYMSDGLEFYIDGEMITKIEYKPYGVDCDGFGIGYLLRMGVNSSVKCKINNIRFYNKKLSEEEHKNNFDVDQKRFK